ncbi:MAG: GIY-YIG nuclease family protein [Rudaea sp.]
MIFEARAPGILPCLAGNYGLVLRLARARRIAIGGLGRFLFPAGWYIYVGSAKGPGGLRARVERHWRGTGRTHWHVDYLRQSARLVSAWYAVERDTRECAWAAALPDLGGRIVVPRFGATDCRCASHLYLFEECPDLTPLAFLNPL